MNLAMVEQNRMPSSVTEPNVTHATDVAHATDIAYTTDVAHATDGTHIADSTHTTDPTEEAMNDASNKRYREDRQQPSTPISQAAPVTPLTTAASTSLELQLQATVASQQVMLESMQAQMQLLLSRVSNASLPPVPSSDAGISDSVPPLQPIFPPQPPAPQMQHQPIRHQRKTGDPS